MTSAKNLILKAMIKDSLDKIPKSILVLEHGCSIGSVTKNLAQKHETVFGIDQSFFAISEAKIITKTWIF